MSGPIDAKPCTCTERRDVDPTGISVKVSAQYPGRSAMLSLVTESVERRSDPMAEVSRGHSSCLFGAKGRTCHERIEGHLSDWLDRSLARGLVMEVGAGSPNGYNKCPETSRRIVNETKLTPETEDRNRPLRNRTAGGVGGRRE